MSDTNKMKLIERFLDDRLNTKEEQEMRSLLEDEAFRKDLYYIAKAVDALEGTEEAMLRSLIKSWRRE